MIDTVPLEVVVMLDVNVSMDKWLANIEHQEQRYEGEHESREVP